MAFQMAHAHNDRLDLFAHYDDAERMSLMRILMRCLQCDCIMPGSMQRGSNDASGDCSHWITRLTTLASLSLALLVMLFFIILVAVRHFNLQAETSNGMCLATPHSIFKSCSPLY